MVSAVKEKPNQLVEERVVGMEINREWSTKTLRRKKRNSKYE